MRQSGLSILCILAIWATPLLPCHAAVADNVPEDAERHVPAAERKPDSPRRHGSGSPNGNELSPEMVKECLAVAAEIDPQLAVDLRGLRSRNTEAFEKQLRLSRRLFAMVELKRRDPAAYRSKLVELNVDAEINRLAEAVRAARRTGQDKDAELLTGELRGQVIRQQVFNIKSREEYLCRLQELTQRVESELGLETDSAAFDRNVEERLIQLCSETESRPVRIALRPRGGPESTGDDQSQDLRPISPENGFRREPWGRRLDRPMRVTVLKLDPEMIELCLEVAGEIDPAKAAKLRELRDRDADAFEQKLRHSRQIVALAQLKKRDPSLYDRKLVELNTDAEVTRLAAQMRDATRNGRNREAQDLKNQLRGQVILQRGFSICARQEHLGRLQELVQRLGKEVEQCRTPEHFQKAVDERISHLLKEPSPRPP